VPRVQRQCHGARGARERRAHDPQLRRVAPGAREDGVAVHQRAVQRVLVHSRRRPLADQIQELQVRHCRGRIRRRALGGRPRGRGRGGGVEPDRERRERVGALAARLLRQRRRGGDGGGRARLAHAEARVGIAAEEDHAGVDVADAPARVLVPRHHHRVELLAPRQPEAVDHVPHPFVGAYDGLVVRVERPVQMRIRGVGERGHHRSHRGEADRARALGNRVRAGERDAGGAVGRLRRRGGVQELLHQAHPGGIDVRPVGAVAALAGAGLAGDGRSPGPLLRGGELHAPREAEEDEEAEGIGDGSVAHGRGAAGGVAGGAAEGRKLWLPR
jgi:hypothetical protein